jgi:hypothetical protein
MEPLKFYYADNGVVIEYSEMRMDMNTKPINDFAEKMIAIAIRQKFGGHKGVHNINCEEYNYGIGK